MRTYIEWIVRFRIWVFAICCVITVLLAIQAKNLQLIIDTDRMLPQSHPYVQGSNLSEETFGSRFVVVIGVTPHEGDIFQSVVLEKIERMTEALQKNPRAVRENILSLSARRAKDIKGTIDGMEVNRIMEAVPETDDDFAQLRQALERNPSYFNAIVSEDFRTAAIVAEFKKGDDGFQGIIDSVTAMVEDERSDDVAIHVSGNPSYLAKIEAFSQRMVYLTPIALLILGLIHLEAFRTLQGLILPLATALLAITWAIGIMGLSGVPLDVFNATTPILILAVAAGHAVQLLKRYYEEYEKLCRHPEAVPSEANRQAVIESVTKIGPVMLAAGGVAVTAFLSLMVFEITVVKTFGFLAGMGILSALIIELTFTPALRSMLPAPPVREVKANNERTFWDAVCEAIALWATTPKYRYRIYGVVAVFVGFAILGLPKIKVDNSAKSMFTNDWQFVQDDIALNSQLGGTERLYFLIQGQEPDAIKDPRVLKAMVKVQNYLETQEHVGKTLSIANFVRRMNQAVNEDSPKFDTIPDNAELISQYLFLYSLSGEPGDFDSYVDYDYKTAQINVFLKTGSTAYLETLIPELLALAEQQFPESIDIKIGGSVPGASALNETMIRDKMYNVLQLSIVIFVIASLMFYSSLAGVMVLLPLLIAVLVNFGLMLGWGGILLNIPNALSSAMAIGIGADYAIYLIFRLREELLRNDTPEEAVRIALGTAGKASLFVASAVAGGYSVLLLSKGFYIHFWLGLLIATSMLGSVFAALTLIPSLVMQFKPSFVFPKPAAAKYSSVSYVLILSITIASVFSSNHVEAEPVRQANEEATDIMEKNYAVSRVNDSQSKVSFTLINKKGNQRKREAIGATKLKDNKVDNKRMTRFIAPADINGTVTVLVENEQADDDMWIYLPALKKVRRLVSSNKKNSFIGTDFSYGDVMGHAVEDWLHSITKEEELDGKAVWVIQSLPKSDTVRDDTGYSKLVHWIHKDNYTAAKREHYDVAGELLKVATYSDIQLVDEDLQKWQPMTLHAHNVQTDHKTIIHYEEFLANQGVSDDYFSVRYMRRQ